MTDNTKEDELRELFRKIIRDYYNKTFEYAMEQLQKGDISAVIANAESKQQALDDPYLDRIFEAIQATYITRAEHERLLTEARLSVFRKLNRSDLTAEGMKWVLAQTKDLEAQLSDKEAS